MDRLNRRLGRHLSTSAQRTALIAHELVKVGIDPICAADIEAAMDRKGWWA